MKKKKVNKVNKKEQLDIFKELHKATEINIESVEKNKKNKVEILATILLGMTFITSVLYLIYNLFVNESEKQIFQVINSSILVVIILSFLLSLLIKKSSPKKIVTIFTITGLMIFISFNFLVNAGKLSLPTKPTLDNFVNTSISRAIEWAENNNIDYNQIYEYSDHVKEFDIISQDIFPGTLLSDISNITFTVSNGPNYDKEVILPNFVGYNIDDALEVINNNFLNNVVIDFNINDEVDKDTVISQSARGAMKRNDELKIVVSLGSSDNLEPIELSNFKNMSLFEATLSLKRNGIKYKLEYQFDDTVLRNYVISQSHLSGTVIDPKNDQITLIVSKGSEIIVPDLKEMTMEEVTNWVIDNNLRIEYSEEFDEFIELGKIINANYNYGDTLEEGSIIKIITSKGQLRMTKFNNLNDFRDWINRYNLVSEEIFEYNNTVPRGSIIKLSHKENEVINPSEKIIIYISNGTPVKIPNFIGKSRSAITSECRNVGLNCTFSYSGYSNQARDIALSQNKRSGSEVISGTYVNIGLSSGIAKTYTVEITESLLSIGNADATISSLRNHFNSKYPGVTFTFVKRNSNTYPNAGFIHESSPLKDGYRVTQGKSYTVWITN